MTAPTLPARPTLPPSNSVRAQPVVVVPGPNTAARARVRTQWLLLAAALTVLAGTLVAWALTRAAARVDVVSIARPVPAGAVIDDADLSVTAIAFDDQVTGLVPACGPTAASWARASEPWVPCSTPGDSRPAPNPAPARWPSA
jgi:hypothetical protein